MRWKFALVALIAAAPLRAAGIETLRARKPDLSVSSNKGIFAVERCIIEIDGPGLPFVYRQPDRPDRTTIAYNGSDGDLAVLVVLSAASGGARIDAWFQGRLVLRQVPDQIRRCA